MSRLLMIATVGSDIEPVLVGIRDYPVRRLVLLHVPLYKDEAAKIVETVRPLRIDVATRPVKENDVLMDTLRQVAEVHATEGIAFTETIMNVSSGDKMHTCSALSAAFVNGIPAIGVAGDAPFALPVLKFSYSELISNTKFHILETLAAHDGKAESLADLSKKSDVEKSLLSYHLRTTREGKGLEEMGLVQIDRGTFGKLAIRLTDMGRLLLLGRIPRKEPRPAL